MQMPLPAMVSSSRIFRFFFFPTLVLLIIAHDQALALAQPQPQPRFLSHTCVNEKGNHVYNANPVRTSYQYHRNLNLLLSSLEAPKNGNGCGFHMSSYGAGLDYQAYAMGLCRGDVAADVCRTCLNNSRHALTRLCPYQKEAIGWYDNCMLRYANRPINGIMETKPAFYMYNIRGVPSWNSEGFFNKLVKLIETLSSEAAAGGSRRKFAIGNTSVPISDKTIYALAQCTPDLSDRQCNDCLVGAFEDLIKCCWGKEGGRVLRASCSLRYEIYLFYDPTVLVAQRLPTPKSPSPQISSSSVPFKFVKNLIRQIVKFFSDED